MIENYITWYENEELTIKFDGYPKVVERYPLPSMSSREKQSIKKYPYLNKVSLSVYIKYGNKEYRFCIPKGYTYDGASIIRPFWRIIGSNTDPSFMIPALIHDTLCENHQYIDNNRYLCDRVFERLLYVAEVPAWRRFLMFHSVEIFQKIVGKWDK